MLSSEFWSFLGSFINCFLLYFDFCNKDFTVWLLNGTEFSEKELRGFEYSLLGLPSA